MNLKSFLAFVLATDAIAWAAWYVVISNTTPAGGAIIVALFYASLFLALVGLFTVIGFALRIYVQKRDELIVTRIRATFRQSALLAALIIIALIMAHTSLLRWWTIALLVLAAALLEHQYAFFEKR